MASRYFTSDSPPVRLRLTIDVEEGYEVVAFLANVGQEEDWKAVEEKALKIGAKKMIIDGTSPTLHTTAVNALLMDNRLAKGVR